jgi:hypothetical protein
MLVGRHNYGAVGVFIYILAEHLKTTIIPRYCETKPIFLVAWV